MPIDLCSSINKTSRWAFGSPVLNSLLGSSIWLAILITIFIVIIIMVMYPAKKNTPLSLVFKMSIYIFLTTMLLLFLHDGIIKYLYDEEYQEKSNNEILRGVDMEDKDVVYNSTSMINPAMQSTNQSIQSPVQSPVQSPIQSPVRNIIEGGYEGSNNKSSNEKSLRGAKPSIYKKQNLFKQLI